MMVNHMVHCMPRIGDLQEGGFEGANGTKRCATPNLDEACCAWSMWRMAVR
ncbi:hypothetical protein HNQ86_001089 [Oleiagrimonas soli]|uniref:Uncharacterized protein n=1 Tax=Oleiagrimonas soli TaxID=1543381 RepID=A0A841KP49_9GAMM|nr:hypothetical protein [Oleiagrimonas soli]